MTLFLCGDVMTGRGIDQILPFPSNPNLYERFIKDATRYVDLAESLNGPIRRPVEFKYIWGAALDQFQKINPDLKLINLETAVTTSENYIEKGINYRMNPKNIGCLTDVQIQCCSLANNHILDWGPRGLIESLDTLKAVNIHTVGAGINLEEAEAPAIISIPEKGRIIIISFGMESSGIPKDWSATSDKPGINLLRDLSRESIEQVNRLVQKYKSPHDIVVASIHWGGNWGYEISDSQRWFAHSLVTEAGVDVIHGHSSHHAKGIEVYQNKLILYGCGDFINDYEGIKGYENFRPELALMYFPKFSITRNLESLKIVPLMIKNFKLHLAQIPDILWIQQMLCREGQELGAEFICNKDKLLEWVPHLK